MRKDLSVGTYNFNNVTLKFYLIFKNFNLAYNFWTVSVRAFIFLTNIPSDKIFLLVLSLLTLTFYLFLKIDIGHNF